LICQGPQDSSLTASPQITFFKGATKRYSNFAIESLEQSLVGTSFGRTVSTVINRNGDLIHKAYLDVTLPHLNEGIKASEFWADYLGHRILNFVEIQIGGVPIDRHYGHWLHVWYELTCQNKKGYDIVIGKTITDETSHIYIPLQFWFTRTPGAALPIVALQFHETKFVFDIAPLEDCVSQSFKDAHPDIRNLKSCLKNPDPEIRFFIDYIFVEADERRRFAQNPHEYLIEQVQFISETRNLISNNKIPINLNHPVKALYWTIGEQNSSGSVKDKLVFGMRNQQEEACGKCSGCLNGNSENDELLLSCVGELNSMNSDASNFINDFTEDVKTYANLNKLYQRLVEVAKKAGKDDIPVHKELNNMFGGLFAFTSSKGCVIPTRTPTIEDAANALLALMSQDTAWLFNDTKKAGQFNPSNCLMPHLQYNYTEVLKSATLLLNNNPRFAERHGSYFNQLQPLMHHTNVPARGIYMYSFCINPEDVQPNGSCNFSRIDTATLKLDMETHTTINQRLGINTKGKLENTMKSFTVNIYGLSVNVFRVVGGMGGNQYAA